MDILGMTITLSSVITIVGCLIGVLNFIASRKKESKTDEARLVSMEKDIQYIRIAVDGINEKLDKHDERIHTLEMECEKRTGGHKE